ncbi:MAG: glycosyltransferase [Verrucomicrobiales bacterium]
MTSQAQESLIRQPASLDERVITPASGDPTLSTSASQLLPGVSVVIPVFNSAQSLPELIARTIATMKTRGQSFEMILVNDGSSDESWHVIRQLASRHRFIRGISLMRNYGQHNALVAGLRAARYELSATLDDDLQHPPEELGRLLDWLDQGYDVVYGTPERERRALWRSLASQFTRLAIGGVMGAETARKISAFRVLRTGLRVAFDRYTSPFVSLDVILTWGTSRFGAVRVPHQPRSSGRSNYTLSKLVSHAINLMTGFSTLPLRLASVVGFVCAGFGVCTLGYVMIRFFIIGRAVPGFAFLAAIISIFSGAQLFALGLIGEYLAKMHFRLMEKPLYVIAEICSQPDEPQQPESGAL